ncbi:MAG: hypothetical protein JXA93_05235 [Anaerolineae bacterium]|nr:hypothetical protein [Anaerolineae bacterium]
MKNGSVRGRMVGGLLVLALLLVSSLSTLTAHSAGLSQQPESVTAGCSYAFTYQGCLDTDGAPVNGTCDFKFGLWTAASGPAQVGTTLDVPGVALEDGVFTARLNFGSAAHTGGARWLEIAVRCPAGSGSYVTLTPRQELTAAPAALALALPFEAGGESSGALLSFWNSGAGPAVEVASQGSYGLYVESAGADGVFVRRAGTPTTMTPSTDKNGFEVAGAQGHGLWVGRANLDGVMIYSAGDDGVTVATAGGDGLYLGSTGSDGVQVDAAAGHGVYVANAALHGYQLDSAAYNGVNILQVTNDGVYVERAGTPATTTSSSHKNGFEVAGAEGNGLYVGSAGINGVWVESAANGVAVYDASEYGMYVANAGDDGLYVSASTSNGVGVGSAGDDGVYVNHAGSPSTSSASSLSNGFEVAGAEGNGVYVGYAGTNGVQVHSASWGVAIDEAFYGVVVASATGSGMRINQAAWDGLTIDEAGYDGVVVSNAGTPPGWQNSSAHNGFQVNGAEGYGLYVGVTGDDGIRVYEAGGDGLEVYGTDYAGAFWGDIYVSGSCIGCVQATFAKNAGDRTLEPGDVVAIQGIETVALDNASTVWRVVSAGGGGAVVGVVQGRADLDAAAGEELREGETGQRLVPRDGAAQPGDYVTIVISGPMRVRASALGGPITPGARLAVGADGLARALQTVVVEGVTIAESTPILGIALDAPDAGGLVWVLVNPQ